MQTNNSKLREEVEKNHPTNKTTEDEVMERITQSQQKTKREEIQSLEKNIKENKIEIKNLKEEISKVKTSQTKNPCRENPAMDNTILQEINDKGNHIKRYTEEINIRLNHQTDTESQQEQVHATLTQQQYAETLMKQHQTAPKPTISRQRSYLQEEQERQ